MNFDFKNIILGFLIGVLAAILFFFTVGDIEIETDIQIGEDTRQSK